ncbi:MAG: PIN domain-containing protein [Mucilaginibacter sp.]|uniref:PIN domain-containing protein n=1 Tax=Mucilaginibacter sp. TaxID=1882438 RepID=UPI0034E447E3
MNADFFIDSNIALYAFDNATFKNKIALGLIRTRPIISTQVVMESVNICLKKFKFSKEVSYQHGINLMATCNLKLIDETTINLAFEISFQYQYSHWDSLIIASALQNNCTKLYSEDLQNGQVIRNKLTIINLFLS